MIEHNKDSVRIVLFHPTNSDQFLVVTEIDDPSNIKLLGGSIKQGEMPDQAAERELKEETRLLPKEVSLRSVGTLINQNDPTKKRYIYSGVATSSSVDTTSEIASVLWQTIESLPEGENRDHIISAVNFARSEKDH